MQSRICAVFDLDDTLFLERDYIRSGFEAVGHWAARWLHLSGFAERCWTEFDEGRRGNIFDAALQQGGWEAKPELIAAMVAIYRTHTPSIELLPDARDALKDLKAVCPIAVITDGPVVSQSRKAEALGIDSIASPVILTELMGSDYRKPHPRAFEQIARDFGGRTFVYIADNPLKDFKAPRNLGWKTIRIRRHGSLHFDTQSSELLTDYELLDCCRLVDILKGI